jgi:hypothetical protein
LVASQLFWIAQPPLLGWGGEFAHLKISNGQPIDALAQKT